MKNNSINLKLPNVDDIFDPIQSKEGIETERVVPLPIKTISNFPDHPFKVIDNEEMLDMVESIRKYGVKLPVIVRPKEDGTYELISGHRRKRASELAGISELPCIIRNMPDDEATILMVDSNLQRTKILPSEKAFSYKMKLEAEKHQGRRTDLTSVQDEQKLKNKTSREKLAEETGESENQIRRYIRLTELVPEILQMVDDEKIAFTPAIEISYLNKDEQYVLLDCMQFAEITPSVPQAIHMKKLSQEGTLTAEKIESIIST